MACLSPHLISASGSDVGLPDGQMGNSEVGHLTIGSGRIIQQELVRISNIVKNNQLGLVNELKEMADSLKKNNSTSVSYTHLTLPTIYSV